MEATGSLAARSASRSDAALAAVLAIGMAAVLAAWGTFGEGAYEASDYLIVLAIIGVAAAVVFGWVVPRGLRKESAGATAITQSVLGVLAIVVFWSGLPPVLAGGGIVLGLAGWSARSGAWLCRTAVVVGLFALAADLVVYVQDMA
jgi:hypothetical protein